MSQIYWYSLNMPEPGDIPVPEEAQEEAFKLESEANHGWNPEAYIQAVELTDNKGLKEYMSEEKEFIMEELEDPKDKTFIDVGAGYGRILPHLAEQAGKVINIELDENQFNWLNRKCADYPNSNALRADANNLKEALKDQDMDNPVLLSFQNSLGTWAGDRNIALDSIRGVAKPRNGEIIISLFRRDALRGFGIGMYQRIYEQSGGQMGVEPDIEKTDFENGIFRSKTGYESHWFSDEEIKAMKERLGGQLAGELKTLNFHIFHIKYS